MYSIFPMLFLPIIVALLHGRSNLDPILRVQPEDQAVTRFREYLRINTSHPEPQYGLCIEWLERQAQDIGLEYHIVHFNPPPALFTVWLTWRGTEPGLKSIMLNSHIDVVPADAAKWKYPPFSATKDSTGDIYARGAQDRKVLGAEYLEAIRRLKTKGYTPKRNVHVTFVPDEEVGGNMGMKEFVGSDEFKMLKTLVLSSTKVEPRVGMNMQFSMGNEQHGFKVTAIGNSSHDARMLKNNAGVKLNLVITSFMKFREEQLKKLDDNPDLGQSDVTSINLSQVGGGLQANVVPSEMWAIFDMRVRVTANWTFDNVTQMIEAICTKAGPGVTYEFIRRSQMVVETQLHGVWWDTIQSTFDVMKKKLVPKYSVGGTDARYLRIANYTAFGFAPLPNTPELLHQDNEHINEMTYLDGIKIFEELIPRLADVLYNAED